MNASPDSSPDQGADRKPVVLVVEDEFLTRTAITAYLRDVGFAVVEAATAAEAKAVIAAEAAVDVVFVDVRLPGDVDGLMLADWVDRNAGDVPVLITSGAPSIRTPETVAGRPFVAKPYIYLVVERRLRELLARKSTLPWKPYD